VHDETQVGLDELVLGLEVALLDALGQRDLLGGGEQRDAADGVEVGGQVAGGEEVAGLLGFGVSGVVDGGHGREPPGRTPTAPQRRMKGS
jgi:hypothetical protein